jgi:hypothetical protein
MSVLALFFGRAFSRDDGFLRCKREYAMRTTGRGKKVVLVLFRVGSFGSALHNFWR